MSPLISSASAKNPGGSTYHSFRTCSLSFVQVFDLANCASNAALPFVCKSLTASAEHSANNNEAETTRAYSPLSEKACTMMANEWREPSDFPYKALEKMQCPLQLILSYILPE